MTELLMGHVTAPSGILLVIDTGYLGLWSHSNAPVMPAGILSDEATISANAYVDLRLAGRDALAAGQMLQRSWNPYYVFDQPPDHGDLTSKLKRIAKASALDARLEVLDARVPHRKRVGLALDYGGGAGEVQYHGVTAVAISGVPMSTSLPVRAESMPDGCHWRRVIIDCASGDVKVSELAGRVCVDYARLLVADVDALAFWEHEEPLDGLADFVFWGRDAQQAADVFGAQLLGGSEFGWLDVPVQDAANRGLEVQAYRDASGLKFAGDFRPHSHHWMVMRASRTSPTESGTADVGGATVCNFMTSWGDGIFDVYRELDAHGGLVQIRIELHADH